MSRILNSFDWELCISVGMRRWEMSNITKVSQPATGTGNYNPVAHMRVTVLYGPINSHTLQSRKAWAIEEIDGELLVTHRTHDRGSLKAPNSVRNRRYVTDIRDLQQYMKNGFGSKVKDDGQHNERTFRRQCNHSIWHRGNLHVLNSVHYLKVNEY